jgi:hypothetical protein
LRRPPKALTVTTGGGPAVAVGVKVEAAVGEAVGEAAGAAVSAAVATGAAADGVGGSAAGAGAPRLHERLTMATRPKAAYRRVNAERLHIFSSTPTHRTRRAAMPTLAGK